MTTTTQTKPGERVYRWYDSGAWGYERQHLTVVRVNRLTVTVETDYGSRFRIEPQDIYPLPPDEDDRRGSCALCGSTTHSAYGADGRVH